MHRQTFSPLRWLFLAVLLLAGAHAARAADEFLDPEVAFTLAAKAQGDRSVELSFTVAPGYYLYGEQFKVVATDATLGTPSRPPGKIKFDETFQKDVESYRGTVRILVPVEQAGARLRIIATNQGCADKGLCYPPMERAIDASLTGFGGDGKLRVYNVEQTLALVAGSPAATSAMAAQGAATGRPSKGLSSSDAANLDAALQGGRFWSVVGVFLVAGLLLSLTPCVLPMLPILSSIIVGQGEKVSRGRGLTLAASYALGMALVYTALGVAAGLAGEGLAAALQNPWVLGLFALGLVALALSMFGAYDLQLPAAFTGRLTQASNRLPAGRLAGVFAMGGISALIVSPCVAAPLAGALVYLSQTRDAWLGGSALFSLAAGMSVPLLVLGASAGSLLPRAGAWMDDIKRFFGLLLLGVALWTAQSLLPDALVLALWGVLAVGVAVLIGASARGAAGAKPVVNLWRRTLAAVLLVFGVLQLIGAASGGSDPLQPLAHLSARLGGGSAVASAPAFVAVRNVNELDAALRTAGRPVMLDFYADWCVSCKEMERYTYSDTSVRTRLAGALLLKADVTANNPEDRELLKRFQLFGPPGTLFFDTQGQEVVQARVIGFQNSARFLQTLAAAGL